jgi:hypothetical protein
MVICYWLLVDGKQKMVNGKSVPFDKLRVKMENSY